MPRKTDVPITGSVLAWAIDEAGLSFTAFAQKVGVPVEVVQNWIDGDSHPGKTEFSRILETVRRPSAIFFMPQPPTQVDTPAAFRRAPGPQGHVISPTTLRELRKARRIQQVMSWLLDDSTEVRDLPIFNHHTLSSVEAGESMRAYIGITIRQQAAWKDTGAALREWRRIVDELGILSFSLQLGKNDVRGFSAWDSRAPVIAVNTAYNESAQNFTIAHELAHLTARTESACYGWVPPGSIEDPALERWCEEFAAAFLLPARELAEFVRKEYGVTNKEQVTDFDLAYRISRRLKVSARALALSLIGASLAPRSLYPKIDARSQVVDRPRERDGGGGQATPEKRVNQYGARVSRTMTDAVAEGALGLRDAADYLDVSLGDLQDIADSVHGRTQAAR